MTVLVQTGPHSISSMSVEGFWMLAGAYAGTFDWRTKYRTTYRASLDEKCVFVRGYAEDGLNSVDAGHTSSFAILLGVYAPDGDDPNPWRFVEALFDACNEIECSIVRGLEEPL